MFSFATLLSRTALSIISRSPGLSERRCSKSDCHGRRARTSCAHVTASEPEPAVPCRYSVKNARHPARQHRGRSSQKNSARGKGTPATASTIPATAASMLDRTARPRLLIGLATMAATALLVPGCGEDECSPGTSFCDGDVAMNCEHKWSDSSAPMILRPEPCGENKCRVRSASTGARAVCLSGECAADAECPARTPYCVDEQCTVCRSDADCSGPGTSRCLATEELKPPCCFDDAPCTDRCSPPPRCGCVEQTDCPAEAPYCVLDSCAECQYPTDCPSGTCTDGRCTGG
jgi:hypothetical protein